MHSRHSLNQWKGWVPWPREVPIEPQARLRVRFRERAVSPWPHPVASWEFGPLTGTIEGIEISLWGIDLHSVRVRTSMGRFLATFYQPVPDLGVSDRLGLEVARIAPDGSGWPLFERELLIPREELAAIKRQLQMARTPPIQWFFVELTNRCNFRCQWCPGRKMTRPRGDMPAERAKTLMEEIARYRRQHPLFSVNTLLQNPIFLHVMGEPLLHPQFFEILNHGHSIGLNFCLVTNVSQMKKVTIKRLLDSGLTSLILSLNVADQAAFSRTGSGLSYDRTMARIQELIRKRYRRGSALPHIEIQLLNSRGVLLPAPGLVEDLEQVQAQVIFWSDFVREQEQAAHTAHYISGFTQPPRWQTVLDHTENDPGVYFPLGLNVWLVFKRACNFGNALLPKDLVVRETDTGHCEFGNHLRTLCVLWDGSCTFCSLDYDNGVNLGNIFDEGIEPIWAGERMNRIRRLMESGFLTEGLCRRCLGSVVSRERPEAGPAVQRRGRQ